MMYMPSGQCPLCRREAYSRETAVRVRAALDGSGTATAAELFVDEMRAGCLGALLLVGLERSMVGDATSPPSIVAGRNGTSRSALVRRGVLAITR